MKTRFNILFCLMAVVLVKPTVAFPSENTQPFQIVRQGDVLLVKSSELIKAGIAVKALGSRDAAVCHQDRCAKITVTTREGSVMLLALKTVADALDAKIEILSGGKSARLQFPALAATPAKQLGRAGQLAPDFRLARLDGKMISLSDFRGKRVVINSWASW